MKYAQHNKLNDSIPSIMITR